MKALDTIFEVTMIIYPNLPALVLCVPFLTMFCSQELLLQKFCTAKGAGKVFLIFFSFA
jgi:hypothetical protein